MDFEVYEDRPRTDAWMRAAVFLPSAIILTTAFVIPADEAWVPALLILTALALAALIYLLTPSKLCILDSAIRIGFRVPVAFVIPFDTVVSVRPSRWSTVGISLPTNMSQSNAVDIIRRRRPPVIITPSDRGAFINSFDMAFKQWKMYEGRSQ